MSIIQSLTQNQSSDVKQLNLSSTLPTKIHKICSLQRFCSLKILNLSNNCIHKIQNLTHLRQLKILNLQFNQIRIVEGIQSLNNLQEIFLSYNSIQIVSQKIQLNQKLKILNLGYNQLKTIQQVMPIFSLEKLVVLSLHGNPFLNTLNYMVFIKMLMPDLLILDDKDLNSTNLQAELYPQEQVAILKDTLNKLLDQRNHLAEELQNLTSISSPTKINLKDYLKLHNSKNSQENSLSNSNVKMATFSPHKQGKGFQFKKKGYLNSKLNGSMNQEQLLMNLQNANLNEKDSEKQKMIQILKYWLKKLQDKISFKKHQVSELHEYYTNKLKQKQYRTNAMQQKMKSQSEQSNKSKHFDSFKIEERNTSKQIFNQIKQKQTELNSYKKNYKAIKLLINQIQTLGQNEEMYKILMMRILFGEDSKQKDRSPGKRQLNYKELKHFLLSEYGLLNAINDLNTLVFGTGQFSPEKVKQLKEWTNQKSLLEIVNQAKGQLKKLKKQQKTFQKQKQQYLKRLQLQTKQLYSEWQQFHDQKKQHQFHKGKQFRYQTKLLQQKQFQLKSKFEELQFQEKQKLQTLQQQKLEIQNTIAELQQQHEDLEQKYERKYNQLEEFQKQFNSFKQEKQNMIRIQEQLIVIKKQLFLKENILAETNQKLKQVALNQQINSERLKFLQRKCYEKSQEIKALDQEERKIKEKVKKLTEEEKLKSIELLSAKEKIVILIQEEKNMYKNIQRHKSNLVLYEQKLKNLSQLESHKKKSLQDFQIRIQQEKNEFIQLNQKNLELEQILAQKEQNIHSYKLKISEHKKSLQSFSDINKNVQQLMQRQSDLKKSILELEIQNGNLIDLKNQMLRELRQNGNGILSRKEWGRQKSTNMNYF